MRFLADMGISPRCVEWLRSLGHDARHLREEGLHRLPDEAIIEKASAEARVVLTMDLDFGYLMAIGGQLLPSVVVFRLDDERPAMVNERLAEVLRCCSVDLENGALISVTEARLRVRRLPVVR